ncbi:nuclear transport factor 2 family protein [Actinacidiphila acidipaludis]|uniref:Nuclear transport factor 2 family protein n=1 Tax=Actinacidiphila acidipaludis TaxID=2873382 RepID=A0ABS7Q1L6_9ACTN|nr:nuclear transport factor 2 family protein [Streptomyces acidipaludis]MBY8877028.1 nuclear transport factor 2 family protein [Streptomyces acidipaludis]
MVHGFLDWAFSHAHVITQSHLAIPPSLAAHLPRRRSKGPATEDGRGQYSVRRDSMPVAVAAALEAMDAWHPDDFAATVAEDAVLDDGDRPELRGRDALRDWCAEECAGARLKMRLTDEHTEEDLTRVGAELLAWSPQGPPHEATLIFAVEDGLIARLQIAGWHGETARTGHPPHR